MRVINIVNVGHVTGGVRYGSQTPIFKAPSSDEQNYDGRKEY